MNDLARAMFVEHTAYELSVALEYINLVWGMLDLWLVSFLAIYLFRLTRDGTIGIGIPCRDWPLGAQAALAIQLFHIGDGGVRAFIWYVRHHINHNQDHMLFLSKLLLFPIVSFAAFAVFSILLQVKVFSQPRNWVWIGGFFFERVQIGLFNVRY